MQNLMNVNFRNISGVDAVPEDYPNLLQDFPAVDVFIAHNSGTKWHLHPFHLFLYG